MYRSRITSEDPKQLREIHHLITEKADLLQNEEKELIAMLYNFDRRRAYIRFGYKSLLGYCNHGLRFTRTQSQRLTTQVRRYVPTVKIEQSMNTKERS